VRATNLVAFCFLTACAASAPTPPVHTPQVAVAKPPAPAPALHAPLTTLHRSDVVGIIDSGFGSFLQRVQVEPSLADGRFRGWTIVDLRPTAFWDAVDLKPGDVVTSVNGLPIERETEAFDAFQSLRTADALAVAYVRGGTERTLSYRIVN
jgi:type II secretory pathway component PulC